MYIVLLTIFGEYFGIKNCATLPDIKNCTYVCLSGRHLPIYSNHKNKLAMHEYVLIFILGCTVFKN